MHHASYELDALPSYLRVKIAPDETGCWIWVAARDPLGYGRVRDPQLRKAVFAHRATYAVLAGPLDASLDLDHLCRVHSCVNPAHLEQVTHAENVRRGQAAEVTRQRYGSRTHCAHGHAFTPDNIYIHITRAGHPNRMCRTCRADSDRRAKDRKRAVPVEPTVRGDGRGRTLA